MDYDEEWIEVNAEHIDQIYDINIRYRIYFISTM